MPYTWPADATALDVDFNTGGPYTWPADSTALDVDFNVEEGGGSAIVGDATSLRVFYFGTPTASFITHPTLVVHASPLRVVHFGRPSSPIPQAGQAQPLRTVRFGHPVAWRMHPPTHRQHGHAYRLRTFFFGTPSKG